MVARSHSREKRAIAFYERGIARLDDRWAGSGETGDRFRDPAHPYAEDLDLFGQGSAFQLISSARTAVGEGVLAGWLMQPSSRKDVELRQQAVNELQSRLDLREDLALMGGDVQAGIHPDSLIRWGNHPPLSFPAGARIIAAVFTACTVVSFSGYMLQMWELRPFLIIVLVQSLFALVLRQKVLRVLQSVEVPARDLALLSLVLGRFEKESFQSERLVRLRAQLETRGVPPSRRIASLRRLIDLHDSSRNQAFVLFARFLLWSSHFAMAIEDWRRKSGPEIGPWLNAIGELEALSSLAGYAAEHPDDPFPEFAEEQPLFSAEGIGHPLLSSRTVVRNDVRLDRDLRLLLISGSNMSGKSTLLRAVGLNSVLAWAGAPVRARRVVVSPLSIGASIRVQDSLQDGKSRFYTEITRLRQIVDLSSGERPLLFLLDELLSGTNSHDRRIGAEAVVRNLVERGALGLVTTHDLALASITETLEPCAANVHFEDHIEDGRIVFDYKMRPGVVHKSNALELMRSIGLDV
ncbi:MAG: MutS-related protein, partial [Bryobacteraceae bacterium]